jgi:(R,R)-butanediol dehydrogenase/meso-butanediol dehydrogenase/diacetyl reductase
MAGFRLGQGFGKPAQRHIETVLQPGVLLMSANTRKAAVWHGFKDIRIEERPIPAVKPGYALIRVDYAGICGTDRHEYVGPNFIPAKKPHRLTGRTAPLIIGHEFSGEIAAIGEGVSGWRIGQRVTANGTLCCKKCAACASGRYNVCESLGFVGVSDDGVFAGYALLEAERLFAIPDNVTQRQALLAEPIACGLHATNLIGKVAGKRVVIIGPGIIGLACFFAALFAGAQSVLVAGLGGERRELIQRFGGVYADTSGAPLETWVKEWSGGAMADIVYECVGAQATLDGALSILAPCGTLMVMGVFEKPPVINMNILQEGERALLTSQAHTTEIGDALRLIAENKIPAEELITKEIRLEDIVEEGFEELLRHPAKHIKIAVNIAKERD